MELLSLEARSPRRLRLAFSTALSTDAFTSLDRYRIATKDHHGASPAAVAAFVVPNAPNVVELALSMDLVRGGTYTVSVDGITSVSGGTTPPGASLPLRFETAQPQAAPQQSRDDALDELLGVDLVWDGKDFLETPTGDLAVVGGPDNVEAAIARRLASDGLPWDDSYGAKPRRYVDGSPLAVSELLGALGAQALADDRVTSAATKIVSRDEARPEETTFQIDLSLLGDIAASASTSIRTQ